MVAPGAPQGKIARATLPQPFCGSAAKYRVHEQTKPGVKQPKVGQKLRVESQRAVARGSPQSASLEPRLTYDRPFDIPANMSIDIYRSLLALPVGPKRCLEPYMLRRSVPLTTSKVPDTFSDSRSVCWHLTDTCHERPLTTDLELDAARGRVARHGHVLGSHRRQAPPLSPLLPRLARAVCRNLESPVSGRRGEAYERHQHRSLSDASQALVS